MRNPLLLNGVFQRAGDVLLPIHLRKSLWPVFARQNLVTHAGNLIIPLVRGRDFHRHVLFKRTLLTSFRVEFLISIRRWSSAHDCRPPAAEAALLRDDSLC